MITNLTKQDLIDFEQDILECFENKQIRAPVHLDGNNENQLLTIFKDIRKQDWCCGTWRFHLQCLLKGVPREELKQKILDGHSISLCFKKYKIISSGIVGDICSIALGLALSTKTLQKDEHIFCFIGEMSSTTGIFHESWTYSVQFDLPITWIIADNDRSVCTPTSKVWNYYYHPLYSYPVRNGISWNLLEDKKIIYYQYTPKFVHAGGGNRINF